MKVNVQKFMSTFPDQGPCYSFTAVLEAGKRGENGFMSPTCFLFMNLDCTFMILKEK